MTLPVHVACSVQGDVPTPAVLGHIQAGRSLVLSFPSAEVAGFSSGVESLVDRISRSLPEYFSVFVTNSEPGLTNIAVRRVIDRESILRHEEELVDAIRRFRDTARLLVERLAELLEADPSGLWTGFPRTVPPGVDRPRGPEALDQEWTYWFHGREIGFENRRTGQEVEVQRDYEGEFGALDPWFFGRFVRTTEGLEAVTTLFGDDFHDPLRALEVLESRGRLRRVEKADVPLCSGLVLNE